MKQMTSFAILSPNGNDRITFAYDEINEATGEPVRRQVKKSFFVTDAAVEAHINAIRQYIKDNKLGD